jgi:Tol biopolymer transport system component
MPRVSTSGEEVSYTITDGGRVNIWVYPLSGTEPPRQLTFTPVSRFPIWSGNGTRIVYQAELEDKGIWWQPADGTGVPERLTTAGKDESQWPMSWSRDGRTLAYYTTTTDTNAIWLLTLPDGETTRIVEAAPNAVCCPALSPDGRWIAYQSTEGERKDPLGRIAFDIYVQPLPTTGEKHRVSVGATGSDSFPTWSRDGKQLYYLESQEKPTWKILSVDVKTQPSIMFGKPVTLSFETVSLGGMPYDVTRDGRFLLTLFASDVDSSSSPFQINVILNWQEDLKQRVQR